MHSDQYGRLACTEYHNVSGWREQTFGAMIKEIRPILMLHNCLDAQYHAIPQRHNVQRNAFVDQCGPIEFVVAAHSQFLMMPFDDVIVELWEHGTEEEQKSSIRLFTSLGDCVVASYSQRSTPNKRIECTK